MKRRVDRKDKKTDLRKQDEGCGLEGPWIPLAHYTVQWRARVNAVMNLRVPWKEENVLNR
jgi:hypothetical protein